MFLENKYTRWYMALTERAIYLNRKKTKNEYFESHHILPKCMGGTETVLLTAKEHYICHLLLCRITTGTNKHKMINALIKMAFSKSEGQKRYTAKSYSLVRKLIAEKNSETMKGVPKSEKAKQNMKGRSGTWKREDRHKERMVGLNNPMYGKTGNKNNARKPGVGDKISQSKIGRKRIYRSDGSHYYERIQTCPTPTKTDHEPVGVRLVLRSERMRVKIGSING